MTRPARIGLPTALRPARGVLAVPRLCTTPARSSRDPTIRPHLARHYHVTPNITKPRLRLTANETKLTSRFSPSPFKDAAEHEAALRKEVEDLKELVAKLQKEREQLVAAKGGVPNTIEPNLAEREYISQDVPLFSDAKLGTKEIKLIPGPGSDNVKPLTLSRLWLRDSCSCSKCLDPDSGQKTFSTTDLPDIPATSNENVRLQRDGSLEVIWEKDSLSNGESHRTIVSANDLNLLYHNYNPRIQLQPPIPRTLWDNASFTELVRSGACHIDYNDWRNNDEAFWAAFHQFTKTGLIFLTNVPQEEHSVINIANRIGPLQYTFYGWTWDVKSKPRAENVAYTNVFLGLHQDLMYHDPIPRLQLLHCLANSCEGGESIFSDGVHAALQLYNTDREAYDFLVNIDVPFGYDKGGHHYFSTRKTIEADPATGAPFITHWAPPFQTSFPSKRNGIALRRWRDAAEKFQKLLEKEDNMYEVKMKPGECVIFDNSRVLHGRREFETSTGSRWLKGTYITPQVYRAKETELVRRLSKGKPWPLDSVEERSRIWQLERDMVERRK
ncbi:putative gamma-butyrobetaine dioxygenase [Triangularia verruculosa]|uniref:Gamma-butyrobetaine dioxygenase n=1 Tax=Triangularia verruculosa TaxID=2587418 RepID=A0AAN7AZC3_9PEZI|nr:putative gamma-butyrobetaine dioxygenase [Triangularia verruculosa]